MKILNKIVTCILYVLTIGIMLFTLISVNTLNRTDRNIFGYRAFIVLSDSMSKTDFAAGDLIVSKYTDPASLNEGDIISFVSTNEESYGETVTHKIRMKTVDNNGDPGFVTYGTTTDTNDSKIVTYPYVLGVYKFAIPKLGLFFNFLKSVPGYFICIFTPFALLIVMQAIKTIQIFKEYKKEEQLKLEEEKLKLEKEKEEMEKEKAETRKMMEELLELKKEIEAKKE